MFLLYLIAIFLITLLLSYLIYSTISKSSIPHTKLIPAKDLPSPEEEEKQINAKPEASLFQTPGISDINFDTVMEAETFSLQKEFPLFEVPKESPSGDLMKSSACPFQALKQTNSYIKDLLCRPHPSLGRSGPMCPFMPSALKMNRVYYAFIYAQEESPLEEVKKVVRKYIKSYKHLEPTSGPQANYRAIVMVFPSLKLEKGYLLINEVQASLKKEVTKMGLMFGEFHMYTNICSLRNKNFYPLRTPYPILAIRTMVPGDIAFLNPQLNTGIFSRIEREAMLEHYIQNFKTKGAKYITQDEMKYAVKMLEEFRGADKELTAV